METQKSSNSCLRTNLSSQAKLSIQLALITWFACAFTIVYPPVTSTPLQDVVCFVLVGIFQVLCPIVSLLFGILALKRLKDQQTSSNTKRVAISGIVLSALYLFLFVYMLVLLLYDVIR
jgi:uncharacterized membrane protein